MNPYDKVANGTLPIDLTNDPKLKELILKSMQKKGKTKEKKTPKVGGGSHSTARPAQTISSSASEVVHHVEAPEVEIFTLDDIEAIDDDKVEDKPVTIGEVEGSKLLMVGDGKRHQDEPSNGANKKPRVSLSHLEDDE